MARMRFGLAAALAGVALVIACGARTKPQGDRRGAGGASVASSTATSTSTLASTSSKAASSSGAGGGAATGCSDGTREGFVDAKTYPKIAACSGGFGVPGMLFPQETCARAAGNTSANPSGKGCGATDLCALGFHVCNGPAEVAVDSPTGCAGAAPEPGLFFATRQSSTGCSICTLGNIADPAACTGCNCAKGCAPNPSTANDLFGCGSLGDKPYEPCGVLDRFSNNLCAALGEPWSCGSDGCNEANTVTKSGPTHGGVLCCAN